MPEESLQLLHRCCCWCVCMVYVSACMRACMPAYFCACPRTCVSRSSIFECAYVLLRLALLLLFCMFTCMYVYMYVCLHVRTYVCMYVWCVFVCVCLCVYECMCVHYARLPQIRAGFLRRSRNIDKSPNYHVIITLLVKSS